MECKSLPEVWIWDSAGDFDKNYHNTMNPTPEFLFAGYAALGQTEWLKKLISKRSVDIKNVRLHGKSPMQLAMQNGHADMVLLLTELRRE
ncbi:MAG: ankyrin repeat domain-containing protein [Nitrospinota bacterium]|nr:ankyrin repeat domain-containing protein [Nitrospinota bacterium]